MLTRVSRWMILGSVGLTACAMQPIGHAREYPCGPGICKVEVTVAMEGTLCVAKLVDPTQTTLRMPGYNGVVIQWQLHGDVERTHEFRDTSIRLKSGSTTQFQHDGAIGGGKKYQIVNKNSDSQTYEYYIKVYSRTTAQVCDLDPFIRNVN